MPGIGLMVSFVFAVGSGILSFSLFDIRLMLGFSFIYPVSLLVLMLAYCMFALVMSYLTLKPFMAGTGIDRLGLSWLSRRPP